MQNPNNAATRHINVKVLQNAVRIQASPAIKIAVLCMSKVFIHLKCATKPAIRQPTLFVNPVNTYKSIKFLYTVYIILCSINNRVSVCTSMWYVYFE